MRRAAAAFWDLSKSFYLCNQYVGRSTGRGLPAPSWFCRKFSVTDGSEVWRNRGGILELGSIARTVALPLLHAPVQCCGPFLLLTHFALCASFLHIHCWVQQPCCISMPSTHATFWIIKTQCMTVHVAEEGTKPVFKREWYSHTGRKHQFISNISTAVIYKILRWPLLDLQVVITVVYWKVLFLYWW